MTTTYPPRSTILIVDDDPTVIKILLNILEDDYELQQATSGQQALSLLTEEKKPDLILLDVMMPLMSGYELYAALKHDATTSTIPVIFITGKADTESETEALAAGAVDFIHKPINREVLLARLRNHLETELRMKALHRANSELTEWNGNLKNRVLQQTALVRQKIEEANQLNARNRQNSEEDEGRIATSSARSGETQVEKPLSILCVDDEEFVIKALIRLFHKEPFTVLTATSGAAALTILKNNDNIGVILSDHRMPEMTGVEFLHAAATVAPDSCRMILTGYADMNNVIEAINNGGAVCFMTKPWNDDELLDSVRDGLLRFEAVRKDRREKGYLAERNSNLKNRLLQQTALVRQKVEEAQRQNAIKPKCREDIVFFLADLLERRHRRLSAHSRTVADLAAALARQLALTPSQEEEISQAGLLHDVGLIGVSDRLLINNMEFLSGTDMAEYRSHPVRGQEIVDTFEELQGIGLLIRHHHEAFDGSGFPDGLAGSEISLGGQIIHLASFIESNYAQLTGDDAKYRVSKKVVAGMGTLFDPALAVAANQAMMEVLTD